MATPGTYLPDATEGVERVEDLPPPRVVRRRRNRKHCRCPGCGHKSYRHKVVTRTLHDLGDLTSGQPCELHLTYSQHYCHRCRRCFNVEMSDLASPGSHYTHRVVSTAVRLVVEDGMPYRAASWHLWRDHRVFVPFATIQNWVEAGGKRCRATA